jgi:hypothetical protein
VENLNLLVLGFMLLAASIPALIVRKRVRVRVKAKP